MSRRFVLSLLVMGMLSGCVSPGSGTPAPQQESMTVATSTVPLNVIVLEVTGTAVISSLTLVVDGSSSEENSVKLPWRRSFDFPAGGHEWKLVLRYSEGDVLATSTANGRLLTQAGGSSSPGSDSSTELSGSISG
ncbi:hypothetical protein ABZ345_26745 [Lentzea sp. NPDC005914]|uniref:hypothetical protein n=1 Tax=Lentzea sp. NPDC005914 TaxID=3154572 RepID=UPI0034066C61